jgi:lauroyl/myristoyl acyltransferase
MNAQTIINSRLGVEAALWMGRTMPPRVGYALATLAADMVSRQRGLAPVRAVRANQWVVHDCKPSREELDRLVRDTYRNAACCIYDFYHLFLNNRALMARVDLGPSFERLFEHSRQNQQGTIMMMSHVANYDLVGRAMALRGFNFQAITPAVAFSGYHLQNRLRVDVGMTITPASMEAVRMATQRLREGGAVVTGGDRPMPDAKYLPRFFGLPAPVPVAHVRLALKLDLPVYVIGVAQDETKRYRLWVHGPVAMQRCSDSEEEIILNAEVLLKSVEENIRQYPVQWNMTYPVWPQVMNEVA